MATSKSQNDVTLSGIVCKNSKADATTAYDRRQNGNIVAFRLAHGMGKDKDSLFVNCIAFVAGFKKRGVKLPLELLTDKSRVLVKGYLAPNNWTNSEGRNIKDWQLIVTEILDNNGPSEEEVREEEIEDQTLGK